MKMNVEIMIDDLVDGAIEKLLNKHLQEMRKYSPPESIHALCPENLEDSSVTFWAARVDGVLAGCGALKEISPIAGEIKSMKTDSKFLRKGIASRMLSLILDEAKNGLAPKLI